MEIDNYSYGRIRIGDRVYEDDLIVYADRVVPHWSRKEEERVSPVDIRDVIDSQPEVVVIGQGDSPVMELTPDTKRVLHQQGIDWVERSTDAAIELFNEFQQEHRKAVGLFHLGP